MGCFAPENCTRDATEAEGQAICAEFRGRPRCAANPTAIQYFDALCPMNDTAATAAPTFPAIEDSCDDSPIRYGLWALRAQFADSQSQVQVDGSYLKISPGSMAGAAATVLNTANMTQIGTVLFVDNSGAGDTMPVDCPGQAKCIFVSDGQEFQKLAQVDYYRRRLDSDLPDANSQSKRKLQANAPHCAPPILRLATETLVANTTLALNLTMASMLIVEARGGATANQVTLTGPRLPGTVVVVLNRDDDDLTGDLDCPGLSKCIFVCSFHQTGAHGRQFEKFAQVDFYRRRQLNLRQMQSEDVTDSRAPWQLPSQENDAAEIINITSSFVGIAPVAGSTNNFAAFASSSQPQVGTLVAVENRDDNDLTGALDCPALAKCFFVHDGTGFQIFSQVDFY